MDDYLMEFGTVALAHALAVASPGPDFTLVLRQSLAHGRRAAVLGATGIGCGILVHVSYSLAGVGALMRHQPQVFAALKYGGAAYLAWLGVQALRASVAAAPPARTGVSPVGANRDAGAAPADPGAWWRGFLTNLLNPKATVFFVALFSVGIAPSTPPGVAALYGVWMALATVAWFSLVAVAFTQPRVQAAYRQGAVWIDRALGLVFLGFAASLVWD